MSVGPEAVCGCVLHSPAIPEANWDDSERQLVTIVQEHGWYVASIFDPDGNLPWWSFTVGLFHTFQTPDLAMVGLGAEGMLYWLNRASSLVRDGLRPQDGDLIPDVLEGHELRVQQIAAGWAEPMLGFARWFYQHPEPPMQQLVWPDPEGLWPEDADATENCRIWQARLWLPPAEHPPGPWTESLD